MQNPTFPSASTEIPAIDQRAATDRLMELLAISAPTGHELPVVEHLRRVLEGLGVAPDLIRVDDAASRISLPCESGNLLVSLPGSLPGPR